MSASARGVSGTSPLPDGWTWATSVLVHAAAAVGVWILVHSMHAAAPGAPPASPAEPLYAVELPGFSDGVASLRVAPDDGAEPPLRPGGAVVARVDTEAAGRGGDPTVDLPATHLSDRDERLRFTTDTLSRLDRDQVQRLRSAPARASWEDRRATTHPSELTFVASGEGHLLERRAPSPVDPSLGARDARPPTAAGGLPGGPDVDGTGPGGPVGARTQGREEPSPGRGVRSSRPGDDHRASAAVGRVRPDVAQAPVSVQARDPGRVRDDVDAEQEVAIALQSLVHGSTAGGLPLGRGRGGSEGGGDPGVGGPFAAAGSHPPPLGDGASDWFDIDTSDPRLVPYFRNMHRRIDPLWAHAFPKSAMLDLKQGTVILELTVARDGSVQVAWPPVRPSGIDEFDRNCAEAVRRAAPFGPIPLELGRGSLRVRAPFAATSAIVP